MVKKEKEWDTGINEYGLLDLGEESKVHESTYVNFYTTSKEEGDEDDVGEEKKKKQR